MKNNTLTKFRIIFFLLLFPLLVYSQDKGKRLVYYNENFDEISSNEFNKATSRNEFLDLYFNNDSLAYGIFIRRKKIGKLNENRFKKINEYLSFPFKGESKFAIIIYYPGKDGCNKTVKNTSWNIFHNDFLKKIKKKKNLKHFWVYKNNNGLHNYYPNKVNWQKDDKRLIEKIFFKYHFPCANFVIIDKEGRFISHFGEFGKNKVWEVFNQIN